MPANWFEAFQQLIAFLEKSKNKKKIIFIDELPWMDTSKSDCINALEHFWNHWASARKDIKLIVCGSAASWMLKKIIRNKGGLHNRVTQKIKLLPFTLAETEQYLQSKNLKWNRYQIAEAYMVMGGIPYYLNGIKKGKSAAQCIDKLCFNESGLLYDEFNNLYASLFRNSANYISVVEALSKKAMGLTREQIVAASKLANGGGLSKVLDELEESGFIRKYLPFKNKLKHSVYQLTDFYTLFYFNFIKNKKTATPNYWETSIDSQRHRAWAGYAFEQVCQAHVHQIKKALGISGVHVNVVSWRSSNAENNTQVDLIIDRNDQVINLCEIKFSINQFTIDKKYAAALRNRIDVFKRESKTNKAVFLTMLTTYGIKENIWSSGLVQNDLSMDCLFEA